MSTSFKLSKEICFSKEMYCPLCLHFLHLITTTTTKRKKEEMYEIK